MTDQRSGKSVLIILPEFPYPFRANGLSLRYFPIIEHLSKRCVIDLIITGKYSADPEIIKVLDNYCRKTTYISYPTASKGIKIAKFIIWSTFLFPWAMPRSWIQYERKNIMKAFKSATDQDTYDVVICVTGYNYPLVMGITGRKLIVDFVDSPSLLAKRNVIGSSRTAVVRKYEWLKMVNWEAKIIRKADSTIYISPIDAGYVPSILTPGKQRTVIPNGYSAAEYTASIEPSVRTPNIGFLGNMSYFPNIESVQWLYNNIFKPLREKRKNLTLYIIGRSPDESIVQLTDDQNVHVTGLVENIWPYINAIDVFVFPILRGGGLKNKILETMFAKRPVVTTSIGNEGLNAVSGRDLIICREPDEFRQTIERLLESPSERQQLGTSGHRYVVDRFAWEKFLKTYEMIVSE